jgi:hypothetical protein
MSPRASVGDFAAQMRAATVNPSSAPTVSLGEMVATAAQRSTGITALTNPNSLVAVNASLSVATGHNAAWKSVTVDGGVPPELAKYGNGRIPPSELESIGIGEHRLWSPAAEAFTAMRSAAAADGVTIGVTDSYRSYDQQVDLVRRKGLYKDGGIGAVPGTSEHGWGRAVDVDVNGAGLTWMRSHAAQFGFTEDTPREPWHWGFQGVASATATV